MINIWIRLAISLEIIISEVFLVLTIICNYNGHNKYFYASMTVVFDAECPF